MVVFLWVFFFFWPKKPRSKQHCVIFRYDSSGESAADKALGRTSSYTRREPRLTSVNKEQDSTATTKDYKKVSQQSKQNKNNNPAFQLARTFLIYIIWQGNETKGSAGLVCCRGSDRQTSRHLYQHERHYHHQSSSSSLRIYDNSWDIGETTSDFQLEKIIWYLCDERFGTKKILYDFSACVYMLF